MKCNRCGLVQFEPSSNNCRRCHRSMQEEPEPAGPTLEPPPLVMPVTGQSIARAIRALRLHKGLSQRQVAARMNVPRSYCSKLECEKARPTLRTLERVAHGLEVSIPELLSGGERSRQDEIRELLADPFIAELLPFLPRLTQVQMRGILLKVSHMTMRQRRTA